MKKTPLSLLAFFVFSVLSFPTFSNGSETERLVRNTRALYESINFGSSEKVEYELFHRAMVGYYQLKRSRKVSGKEIISIVDFRKSSTEKRLWIVDLINKKLLYHSLVAHGRNTGDLYAEKFSNRPNSNQSSLGFYVTGRTYIGKHGISLKLHGMEPGINDKAEQRAVVMHGADYVNDAFIERVGRLGRSFGCPAIPMEIHKEVISKLANGTCLFIYYPDQHYFASTRFNNQSEAARYVNSAFADSRTMR